MQSAAKQSVMDRYLNEAMKTRVPSACLSMSSTFRILPGEDISLSYARTGDGREVDFVLCGENSIGVLIEVKLTDNKPSSGLLYFLTRTPHATAFQLVQNLRQEESIRGVSLVGAAQWLSTLEA